jgi:hypothetical protein
VNELVKSSDRFRGIAFDHRIELSIAGREHRFWSPQLVCTMRPASDGALIEARFGPDPYVWAFYLFAVGLAALVTAWALLFGLVQWNLGQAPTGLYATPVLAIIGALVYGATFVGQGLGAEQMYVLRTALVDVCEAAGTEA